MKLPSRQPIAHSPTPLEHLPRITKNLGGPDIWVKRDDLTGLALGGNKIRKLEFFLAEALNKGADTLITAGAIQSNHCRQTAAVAAKFGLACVLVLTDQRPKELTANNYLDTLLGAQIIWAGDQDRESALNEAVSAAQETGKQPYLVPYGGSNALGACAYLHAMQELAAQTDTPFDWIIFATSSGATQAGLELGRREFMPSAKLLGVSVDMKSQAFAPMISTLTNDCAALVGLDFQSTPQDILVSDAYLGAGYAQMGPAEEEAIQLFAREEALLIDPVYTGRAAAGLINLVRSGNIKKDEKVLFWHTGGAPALFAPQYMAQLTKS